MPSRNYHDTWVLAAVAVFAVLSLLRETSLTCTNRDELFAMPTSGLEINETEYMQPLHSSNKTKSLSKSSAPEVYTMARADRTGSAILHMLLSHAWAFTHNYTFLGTCKHGKVPSPTHKKQQMNLLKSIGLSETLPFKCPPATLREGKKDYRRIPVKMKMVAGQGTHEWLKYIQSRVKYPATEEGQPKRAVVHIRRGDVTPCLRIDSLQRYLPNWYFKELIEQHVPKDYDIIIHSEEFSYEPWTDFTNDTNRKYQLHLSAPLLESWQDIMTADVFINSRSHFSTVPAFLNRNGTVIHTPKPTYEPLPHWTVVNYTTVERAIKWNLDQQKKGVLCRDKTFLTEALKNRKRTSLKQEIQGLMSRANH